MLISLARIHTARGLVLWIALVLTTMEHPAFAQTLSFLRELSPTGYQQSDGAAVDATGVYTIGWEGTDRNLPIGLVRKHDNRGNEQWTRRLENNPPSSVAVDATGNVYVVGPGAAWERNVFVSKLSSQGNPLWTRQFESRGGAMIALHSSGIYVAWTPVVGRQSGVSLNKLTADGDVIWTVRPNFSPASFEHSMSLAANATGVYLSSAGNVDFASTFFLRGFNADGRELWTRRFIDGWPGRLAADATGLYAVDAVPGLLRKYNLAGEELWTRQVGTRNSIGGVAVDASGVYVGGFVEKTLPGQCATGTDDAVVRRYTAAGEEVWTRQFGLTSPIEFTTGPISIASVALDAGSVYFTGRTPQNQTRTLFARIDKSTVVIPAAKPHIYWDCVVNAASYIGGGVSPGEIVSVFGSSIGPPELTKFRLSDDGRLATTLAETRILFNGVPAPLLYTSSRQSSAIVPYSVAGRESINVQVEYRGVRSDEVTVPVRTARPGIFSLDGSGSGQGAVLIENGSVNSAANPARKGSIITIYATGGGEAAAGVADGQILGAVLPRTSLPVSVFFGYYDPNNDSTAYEQGEVLYAGGSSGSVAGLLQVNVRLPAKAMADSDFTPLVLRIGSHWTPLYQTTIAMH